MFEIFVAYVSFCGIMHLVSPWENSSKTIACINYVMIYFVCSNHVNFSFSFPSDFIHFAVNDVFYCAL